MASTKQQNPANETCPQEQHKFWGGKVFGGHKPNTDQQNSGWWFGGPKQATTATTHTHQHCNTCQCSAPDKSMKQATSEGVNKKEHTIVVTNKEEHITATKHDKGTSLKHGVKTEMKEQHVGNVVHGKNNVCNDAKSKGTKEEVTTSVVNNKASLSGGVGKKKENHCFRNMAGHVKQRIAMMRNGHDGKGSDSSSSDSEDEKTDKKKKEKGHSQSHGPKMTAK